jgi:hypothetical protein
MLKYFFASIIAVLFIEKSSANNYQCGYTDTIPHKSSDTLQKFKPDTLRDKNIIFTKAEIPPSVDQTVWRKHLQTYLVSYIESAARKNIPAGTYIVQIRFLVDTNGSIKDVKALNDVGYGLTKAAIKVVEESPKWVPAMQNGTVVPCYHTLPITFVIQMDK